jgi:hypothetical protein
VPVSSRLCNCFKLLTMYESRLPEQALWFIERFSMPGLLFIRTIKYCSSIFFV